MNVYMSSKNDDDLTLQLALKVMVLWVDNLWGWISLAGEVSRLAACPGRVSVSLAFGFLIAWWTLRTVDFRPTFRTASAARFPSRPRLDRYLNEWVSPISFRSEKADWSTPKLGVLVGISRSSGLACGGVGHDGIELGQGYIADRIELSGWSTVRVGSVLS